MEVAEASRSSTPGDTNGCSDGEVDLESTDPLHDHVDNDDVERTSNMWIASAYSVTAIIGVGVLGLPQAMVFLTWFTLLKFKGPGLVILLLALLVTCFTLKQLTKLHEFEYNENGRIRYETYYKLGQIAFGERASLWIILPLQVVVEVSLDILFTVAAGEAMNLVSVGGLEAQWHSASGLPTPVNYTLPEHLLVDHCVPRSDSKLSHVDLVFRACSAIGVVAFAYAVHTVALEIQNGIPSTSTKSSEAEMLLAVKITYVVVALCYLPMGIAFYTVYGNQISQNALSFLQYQTKVSKELATAANIVLIIHLIGAYQIFGMPVFKLLEIRYRTSIEPMFQRSYPNIKRIIPYLIRPLYIVLTTALAMIFPYFSPLLGFFGGFAIAPTTCFLPCIIWLELKKPERWSMEWFLNWVCIVFGVLLMIVASVGGAYALLKESLSDNYRL